MKYALILILILGKSLFLFGQTDQPDYETMYNNAKTLFNEGKYGLAQVSFKALLEKKNNNPYVNYATYYYGLAAYKEGYPALARDTFAPFIRDNPNWYALDEVKLWLVQIYSEMDEIHKAIPIIDGIKDDAIVKESLRIKAYFLNEIDSITPLLSLHHQFPSDSMVGSYLARAIVTEPIHLQDRDLLAKLVVDFNLEGKKYGIITTDDQLFKEEYNVAVLLPFLTQRLQPNLFPKVNQFVLDLYQGMILATEILNEQGSKINLRSYDTKRDSTITQKILQYPEVKSADFIYGPLYNTHLTSKLSFENQVNILNPLSRNTDFLRETPYSFLVNEPPTTIAETASTYALKNFQEMNGLIFYGETNNDYLVAKAYADTVRKYGQHILDMKRIGVENIQDILMTLTNNARVNDIDTIIYEGYMDSIDCIFISSEDQTGKIYANVLPGVAARGDTIEILGSRNWTDDEIVNINTLERLRVKLCAPSYLNTNSENYLKFQQKYINRFGINPSKFSAIGFETILYFGRMLQKHGRYFQPHLASEGFIPGHLFHGYDFSNTRYNVAVPIVKITNGRLMVVEEHINEEQENESKQ